jgi:hypothetical protein
VISQPQQKRVVDDLDRRINSLFDALNCETLSKSVVDQLLVLATGQRSQRNLFLPILISLLFRLQPRKLMIVMLRWQSLLKGSQTDDVGLWISELMQLIMLPGFICTSDCDQINMILQLGIRSHESYRKTSLGGLHSRQSQIKL